LQPGSNVGHFAQSQLFLTAATTHGPNDHQSGVDAQAHREPNTPLLHQAHAQCVHSLDHPQSSPHRAQGVIFMGLGVAKVDQEAIAQILRNVSLKAPNHLGADGLVGADHLTPVFWIELPGQRRRAHQVAKQHGQLSAFGLMRTGTRQWRCPRGSPLSPSLLLFHQLSRSRR
jgi:hypothetical protein